MPDLLAITIWQPWATLIAEGCKPYEFRGWAPSRTIVGQRIAVHAGARPVRKDEVRQLLLQLQGSFWRESGLVREPSIKLLTRVLMAPKILPLSSILCTAMLGQPIQDDVLAATLGIPAIHDSNREEHSNFGWPLTDIERLEPFVPARGAQGFWKWHQPETATPDAPARDAASPTTGDPVSSARSPVAPKRPPRQALARTVRDG